MTAAPWLGEMTAEERAGAIRQWLVNIGAVNLDGIAAAIRDAEQRATAKMREAAAKRVETLLNPPWHSTHDPAISAVRALGEILAAIRALP